MKLRESLLIIVSVLCLSNCGNLTASLKLIQYEPIVFRLTFNSAVAPPTFQLLLNNIYRLEHQFLSSYSNSTTFSFKASLPSGIKPSTSLETYSLLFNNPLEVGNGQLGTKYFLLSADKEIIQIPISPAFGIAIAIFCYLSSYFSILGQLFIEFTQIFVLFCYGATIKTSLYVPIAKYLFMLPPIQEINSNNVDLSQSTILLNTGIPLLIIGFSFVMGYIIKKLCKNKESIVANILYQFFTYGFFHTMGNIFILVIFFNAIINTTYLMDGQIVQISSSGKSVLIFLIYLSFASTFFYLYSIWRVLNPRLGDNIPKWKAYVDSKEYKESKKLHDGLHNSVWFKRNSVFIKVLKRIVLVIFFFTIPGFTYVVLIFQFFHLFFIFTTKPFKEELYYTAVICFRTLMFIYYVVYTIGNLYFGLNPVVINYRATEVYLYLRVALFAAILFAISLMIFYELYQKCSNLNYQIKLVKEENQYKLKITQRSRVDSSKSSERKRSKSIFTEFGQTQTHPRQTVGGEELIDSGMKLKKHQSQSKVNRSMRSKNKVGFKNGHQLKSLKKVKRTESKYTDQQKQSKGKSESISKRQKQQQIQMATFSPQRNRINSKQTDESGSSFKQAKKKKKWSDKSLLAQFVDQKK